MRLFVSTSASSYRVHAWRMGFYGGSGGRLVWTSPPLPGRRQPPARLIRPNREVVTSWRASVTIPITSSWPPGDYLLDLDTGHSAPGIVPLTIRPPQGSHTDVTFVNATATWEIYNRWGGYSGYVGPTGFASRSLVVSDDRPYDRHLRLDYLEGELPLVRLIEQSGRDTYTETTDDLDGGNIGGHPALIAFGWHDEYVTTASRQTLEAAVSHGVNLAFFGANQVYWRPRHPTSPAGTDQRQLVIDRIAADDRYGNDPALASGRWRDPPIRQPERRLIGEQDAAGCLSVDAPMTVGSNWLFQRIGLPRGQRLPHLVYDEIDAATTPPPAGVQVLAATAVTCPHTGRRTVQDTTLRMASPGSQVFDAGTVGWVCVLDDQCNWGRVPRYEQGAVAAITRNVLTRLTHRRSGQTPP